MSSMYFSNYEVKASEHLKIIEKSIYYYYYYFVNRNGRKFRKNPTNNNLSITIYLIVNNLLDRRCQSACKTNALEDNVKIN